MKTAVFVFTLMATSIAYGQMTIDAVPAGPDLDDLYERLSESAFVVRGKTLAYEPVTSRSPGRLEQAGPNKWRYYPDPDDSGVLYTVAIEQVLCRRRDFAPLEQAPAAAPSMAQVFVQGVANLGLTQPSRFTPHKRYRMEFLLPGVEYLLFLWELPGQSELVKRFNLAPGTVYYRAMDGERGAIRLPDAANPERPRAFIAPLVEAVTTFCEAVKAPDADEKIQHLNAVRDKFAYPAWRQSVDEAIKAFKQAGMKPEEE